MCDCMNGGKPVDVRLTVVLFQCILRLKKFSKKLFPISRKKEDKDARLEEENEDELPIFAIGKQKGYNSDNGDL